MAKLKCQPQIFTGIKDRRPESFNKNKILKAENVVTFPDNSAFLASKHTTVAG